MTVLSLELSYKVYLIPRTCMSSSDELTMAGMARYGSHELIHAFLEPLEAVTALFLFLLTFEIPGQKL